MGVLENDEDTNQIKLNYVGYDIDIRLDIRIADRIAKYRSMKNGKADIPVSRPCMKNKKIGDFMYVNYGYHPVHGHDKKWTKCKIVIVDTSFCFEALLANETHYWLHPDSQYEVACLDDKCEYCFR